MMAAKEEHSKAYSSTIIYISNLISAFDSWHELNIFVHVSIVYLLDQSHLCNVFFNNVCQTSSQAQQNSTQVKTFCISKLIYYTCCYLLNAEIR